MWKLQAPDGVDLWLVPAGDGGGPRAVEVLSSQERQHTLKLRRPEDRALFAATRTALRVALAGKLGVEPGALAFEAGPGGRPRLAAPWSGLGWQFNVAHSGSCGIVAVCRDADVGVDIEQVHPDLSDRDAIVDRHFSPRERAWLEGRPRDARGRGRDFFRVWVVKEALAKCLGLGLATDLKDLEADFRGDALDAVRWRGDGAYVFEARELPIGDELAGAVVVRR